MNGKIPHDAFDYYMSLGPNRSYQAVAEKYGVTKRAVTKLAVRERWQERVAEIERKAREASDQRAVEAIEAVTARHLKALRVIQGKALESLKQLRLSSAMEAVRALDMAIRQERLVYGEPSDRTALSLEDKIRTEYKRWMVSEEPEETAQCDQD